MGDIFVPLLVCFIIFTLIAYCFKRRKGGAIPNSSGVTVTTAHVASPIVNPPYPIDQRHAPAPHPIGFTGVPVSGYPTVGVAPNPPAQGVYPHHHTTHYAAASVTPYIPSNTTMPLYPPSNIDGYSSSGVASVITPRPSAPTCDVQPPSYYEATAQTAVPHEKQSPYNPHF